MSGEALPFNQGRGFGGGGGGGGLVGLSTGHEPRILPGGCLAVVGGGKFHPLGALFRSVCSCEHKAGKWHFAPSPNSWLPLVLCSPLDMQAALDPCGSISSAAAGTRSPREAHQPPPPDPPPHPSISAPGAQIGPLLRAEMEPWSQEGQRPPLRASPWSPLRCSAIFLWGVCR